MIITLDGPCGSGKSTLAQLLAKKLGFFYINSGYLYRALAYLLIYECGYDEQQLHQIQIADIDVLLHPDHFKYTYDEQIAQIFFKGVNITQSLKSAEISCYASIISAQSHVRESIVPLQRHFASLHHIVTDGRDCGTEIYPQAEYKFYINASVQVRAQRLHQD